MQRTLFGRKMWFGHTSACIDGAHMHTCAPSIVLFYLWKGRNPYRRYEVANGVRVQQSMTKKQNRDMYKRIRIYDYDISYPSVKG